MSEDEFVERVDTLRPKALAIAQCITCNFADAEDAVEAAKIEWWKCILRGATPECPNPESEALFYRIVRCRALDIVRARLRRHEVELDAGIEMSPKHRSAPELEEVMALLSADEVKMVRLYYWEGLSQAEIGKVFGISEEAVKVRLYKIRKKLQSHIGVDGSIIRNEQF